MNTSKIPNIPCFTGFLVSAHAWAMDPVPRPASLEKIPLETPFFILRNRLPTTPPVIAEGWNAPSIMEANTPVSYTHLYRIETAEKRSIRFVIDNATVYPDGQMGNNRYTLMDQYGNLICTVCQDNQEQKGILELIKHGEKLYGASDREGTALKEKISTSHFRRIWNAAEYEVRDQVFEYQDAPIEGAVFEVYAAEDIYTQELDHRLLEEYGVDTDAYLCLLYTSRCV